MNVIENGRLVATGTENIARRTRTVEGRKETTGMVMTSGAKERRRTYETSLIGCSSLIGRQICSTFSTMVCMPETSQDINSSTVRGLAPHTSTSNHGAGGRFAVGLPPGLVLHRNGKGIEVCVRSRNPRVSIVSVTAHASSSHPT